MLVLSRRVGQSICLLRSETTITIAKASRSRARLSTDAPREIAICRGEQVSPDDEDTVVEEGIATHWRLEPKSRETRTLPSRSEQSDPANVLVAITDADERRRYADAFRYVGFGASEVTDGISCLSALRSGAFDMLVIDQHLLWGSGDGVVEVMYHDPSIDQIPVALLSFPSPDESPEGSASRLRAFGCTEIVHIVQQRLAGHD